MCVGAFFEKNVFCVCVLCLCYFGGWSSVCVCVVMCGGIESCVLCCLFNNLCHSLKLYLCIVADNLTRNQTSANTLNDNKNHRDAFLIVHQFRHMTLLEES